MSELKNNLKFVFHFFIGLTIIGLGLVVIVGVSLFVKMVIM